MPTRFDALQSRRARAAGGDASSSSSSSSSSGGSSGSKGGKGGKGSGDGDNDATNAIVSNQNSWQEDLSSFRADEEEVLTAVYGPDFTTAEGVWGCARHSVAVRPPDVDPSRVGSSCTVVAQLGKKYPYAAPALQLQDVVGLTSAEQAELLDRLRSVARDCAGRGTVGMCEIVQEAEGYLLGHNRDPKRAAMSAWEQMREREEAQAEAQRRRVAEREEAYRNQMHGSAEGGSGNDGAEGMMATDADAEEAVLEAERELQKQMETLVAAFADRKRMKKLHSDFIEEAEGGEEEARYHADAEANDGGDDDDDDDDDSDGEFVGWDEDADEQDAPERQRALKMASAPSRYRSDFVELGLLGRGGGGEVVKARNFLDRRIYAIKKIPLESEVGPGRHAEVARLHNRKLRREVTTISRMTHSNIVRYYQAWVEGGEVAAADSPSDTVGAVGAPIKEEEDRGDPSDSDGSSDSSGGFWKKSPALGPLQSGEKEGSFECSSGIDLGSPLQDEMNSSLADALHSRSTNAFLEHEFEDFRNPLFAGGALESQEYDQMVTAAPTKITKSSATPSNDLGSGISGSLEDDRSIKVDEGAQTLYIQMEYCANTLRHLIDSGNVREMKPVEVWRIARQTIDALAYIHEKQIIHRDLKPGNIFLDSESNVRLGDFGLATLHSSKRSGDAKALEEGDVGSEATMIHDAVEDISGLLGASSLPRKQSQISRSFSQESLTGGVGTTFYRAPEQEGRRHRRDRSRGDDTSYDMKADIFSFGIVLFEIFSKPFSTYMERAETLLRLRGENSADPSIPRSKKQGNAAKDWRAKAKERFPESFLSTAPEAGQRIILWCIEARPEDRPSADELLKSELLPKKLELESRYLQDALQILSNPQNESNRTILNYLFDRPTPPSRDIVFDTDISLKSRASSHVELLAAALRSLGIYSQRDVDSIRSTALGFASCSQLASILELKRTRQVTKRPTGGSEFLRGAPQRTAINIAALSASSAAITGSADGLLGADPTLVERICDICTETFKQHGATRLDAPLLRPRIDKTSRSEGFHEADNVMGAGGPAELLNTDGTVLLLPEDLTSTFARAVARGGCGSLKRYSISKVFHRSLAGGHPTEKLEASFDIIQDDSLAKAEVFQAEAIFVLSQILSSTDAPTSSSWFLRINHTRLADSILDICGVPNSEHIRRATLRILTACTAQSPTSWQNTSVTNSVDFKRFLGIAIERGLPKAAADRLHILFTEECLPLPSANADKACELLYNGIERLRHEDTQSKALSRGKLKRYEDAHRSLKSIRLCLSLVRALGIQVTSSKQEMPHQTSSPSFVSFDLGFRQRRKHFHGHILFQVLAVSSDYLERHINKHENLDAFLAGGDATRLAEGGRYDDFVRKNRPPGGTLGSSIPICVGVRIFIGPLVEQAYRLSSEISRRAQPPRRGSSIGAQIESIRGGLGHPLPPSHPIKCIVSSTNGLDSASLEDRALVAALLWRSGIPSEYTCNASAFTNPLIRKSAAVDSGAASALSLEELTGVSSILRIPFIVVAQPHLLREKKSVRLRYIVGEGFEEDFVPLEELTAKIKEELALHEITKPVANRGAHNTESSRAIGRQSSTVDDIKASPSTAVQCIYCDEAEYYIQHDLEKRKGSSSDKAMAKIAKKELSRAMQKAEAYIHCISLSSSLGQGTPVIASALPYLVLRDLGTALVTSVTTSGAIVRVAARYPAYKRLLKTVGMSIDHATSESLPSQKQVALFLYSIPDDSFDLIQVGDKFTPLLAPGSPDHRRHRY